MTLYFFSKEGKTFWDRIPESLLQNSGTILWYHSVQWKHSYAQGLRANSGEWKTLKSYIHRWWKKIRNWDLIFYKFINNTVSQKKESISPCLRLFNTSLKSTLKAISETDLQLPTYMNKLEYYLFPLGTSPNIWWKHP